MSFRVPPLDGEDVTPDGRRDDITPKGVLGRLRHHLRTWPKRYVQMRLDTGR